MRMNEQPGACDTGRGTGQHTASVVPERETITTRRPVQIRTADGRPCGEVAGCTWWKSVSASKHQLRKPPAWCFDARSLDQAEAAGATGVRLVDSETGATWSTGIASVRAFGFPVNRGHGAQIGLGLRYWTYAPGRDSPVRPEAVYARL